MIKHFPEELKQMARDPRVKRAFFLDYDPVPGACPNCGGTGMMSLFLATAGPFDEPGSSKFVSKWFDGKWWCAPAASGTTVQPFGTVSVPCPDCKGKHLHGTVPMPAEVQEQWELFRKSKDAK